MGFAAAVLAVNRGSNWLSGLTEGIQGPVDGTPNPLHSLAALWFAGAVAGLVGAVLLGYSRRGGAVACLAAAGAALAGALTFDGSFTIRVWTLAKQGLVQEDTVVGPAHHWPVFVGCAVAVPLLVAAYVALKARAHRC